MDALTIVVCLAIGAVAALWPTPASGQTSAQQQRAYAQEWANRVAFEQMVQQAHQPTQETVDLTWGARYADFRGRLVKFDHKLRETKTMDAKEWGKLRDSAAQLFGLRK